MVVINQMAAGGPSINISLGPGGGGLAVADYTAGSIAKFIFTAIQTSSATPTMTMIPLGPYGGIGSANWVSAFVYGSITTALTSGSWDASTGSRIPAGSLVGSFNYYSPLQVMIFANALGTAQSADGPLPTITDILNQFSNVQVGIPVIVKMICTVKTGIFTWTTYTDAGTTGTVSINDQLITTGPAATSPAGQPANTVYELQLVIVPAGTKATSWSGSDMVIGWVPLSHNVP